MQALGQVGLEQRADHYPRQLSGGEQQRIAIARAIAAGPKILFADEPTGNLDQHTGAQIIDLLLSLRKQIGVALILVTHDAALAEQCDRRLLLDQGRLEPLDMRMDRFALIGLWREWRSGELRLLTLSLILAVAAVTSVGFFTDRVEQALSATGQRVARRRPGHRIQGSSAGAVHPAGRSREACAWPRPSPFPA